MNFEIFVKQYWVNYLYVSIELKYQLQGYTPI